MSDNGRRFLVTFKPCGHVQHMRGNPEPGMWVSCFWNPRRGGCQTPRQAEKSEPCPGCPECPGQRVPAANWQQQALFEAAA